MSERDGEVFRPELGPAPPRTPEPLRLAPEVHTPELSSGPYRLDALAAPPVNAAPETAQRLGARLGMAAAAGTVLLLVAAALDWVTGLFPERPLLACVGAAGLGLLVAVLATLAWREWSALRAMEKAAALRADLLGVRDDPAELCAALARTGARLVARGVACRKGHEAWLAAARGQEAARTIEALFVREVLAGVDGRATAAISRAAREVGVAVMVSPSGAGDLAVFIWRALRLLREVAGIYGLRPGRAAELRLLRRVLAEGALLAATDLAADAAASATGRIGALVAGRAAEGMVGAQRMARFGLLAASACRPLPFDPATAPGVLGVLRSAVASFAGPNGRPAEGRNQ
jgi:putative membrane protein